MFNKKALLITLVIASSYFLYRTTQSNCIKSTDCSSLHSTSCTPTSCTHSRTQTSNDPIHINGVPSPAIRKLCEIVGAQCPETLEGLNAHAQANWLRKQGEERWDLDKQKVSEQLIPLFKQLGLIEEVKPEQKHFEYAFILGALATRMQKRIAYLEQLIQEGYTFNHIVLLAGARPADSTKEAEWVGKTEADIIDVLYKKSSLPQNLVQLVSAPMKIDAKGNPARPTTDDTVIAFLASEQAQQKQGTSLVISDNPFINRQVKVLELLVPKTFSVCAAGAQASDEDTTMAILFDELARTIFMDLKLQQAKKAA